jgi:hypothetical protein
MSIRLDHGEDTLDEVHEITKWKPPRTVTTHGVRARRDQPDQRRTCWLIRCIIRAAPKYRRCTESQKKPRTCRGFPEGFKEGACIALSRPSDFIPKHKSGKARIEAPMREARSLTARTPRRSGHRHRCVAYLADIARAE